MEKIMLHCDRCGEFIKEQEPIDPAKQSIEYAMTRAGDTEFVLCQSCRPIYDAFEKKMVKEVNRFFEGWATKLTAYRFKRRRMEH